MKYLNLIRIKHYLKNVLIVLPLFFSRNIFDSNLLIKVIYGFLCFSFVSSVIYVINDIRDIDNDRKHEKKKFRPLASGAVTVKQAILIAMILLLTVICINVFILKGYSWIILIVYFILNIGYSLGLKEKPIIDIIILSAGFLLRIIYGGLLINVNISNWLFLTVLCGALYMSMGKRRNELIKNGNETRKVLKYYNIDFFNKNMYMFLSMTLVFFSLWSMEMNNNVILLVPLVFAICLKYSLNIENNNSHGDPIDVIFSDKILMLLCFLTGLFFFLIIYFI